MTGIAQMMSTADGETMATPEELVRWRRDLHRIPELGFDVAETLAYVRGVLEALECPTLELVEPCNGALVARFRSSNNMSAVAVRAELDALPVAETTGASFASTHPGCMHACGHDGHMALALGLASDIASEALSLERDVVLVFEPAEETTGGARDILASGILEAMGVAEIYGVHLWPGLAQGQLATRTGALLAGSNEINVCFQGRAAHIGRAADGADAIECACCFVSGVYNTLERIVKPYGPYVLKFGHIEGGEVRNQIAATSKLEGSLRTFDDDVHKRSTYFIDYAARRCAAEFGCTYEISYSDGYPPVTNDASLVERAAKCLEGLRMLDEPLMISDDFAWYQRKMPGLFLLLGTGGTEPLHSGNFDFDESVLTCGLEALERLVLG